MLFGFLAFILRLMFAVEPEVGGRVLKLNIRVPFCPGFILPSSGKFCLFQIILFVELS